MIFKDLDNVKSTSLELRNTENSHNNHFDHFPSTSADPVREVQSNVRSSRWDY